MNNISNNASKIFFSKSIKNYNYYFMGWGFYILIVMK